MSNYKRLKEVLQKEKRELYNKLRDLENKKSSFIKLKKVVDELLEQEIESFDYEKLYRLRKYFPDLEEMFEYYRKAIDYLVIVNGHNTDKFNPDGFKDLIEECYNLYGFPPLSAINDINNTLEIIKRIKGQTVKKLDINELNILLGKKSGRYMLYAYVNAFCDTLVTELMKAILEHLSKEEKKDFTKEIQEIKDKLELIDCFNPMFSNTEMLSKFADVNDFKEFTDLVTPLLNVDECIEIFKQIKIDQSKVYEEIISVSFDNLDTSTFTEEEKKVVEELREIIEDEELKGNIKVLDDIPITYSDRLKSYNDMPISVILLDVEHNLLNEIYDNKNEIISIFKLIIDLYRKDIVFKIHIEKVKELQRIRDDLSNIISFINKTYLDKEKAYQKTKLLNEYIKSINEEYLPFIIELLNEDSYDEKYDDELDLKITNLKNYIKLLKKEMTLYYQNEDDISDIKENTDNLVFCLSNDIDLSQEGFQKEFIGTIESLESKTSRELKKRPGRKGMTRLRKNTENDKSIDFIKYLETRNKVHLHFVPYRYSSDSNYRTGLIKFEPSSKVKAFLEERYGLSKQSAYYGVFKIITSIGANHSEYSYFQDYLLTNYEEIEELAKLFASENPDYNELIMRVDKYLKIKNDNIDIIISNNNSKVNGI